MLDQYNRHITYLRVSVTDRCNLHCPYCKPAEDFTMLKHKDILSLEEIAEIISIAANRGITKVRITGGEPLIRRNLEHLISMIAAIDKITDLSMTTNATMLAQHADQLAAAGLQRINISLDAVDPDTYAQLSGGGDVTQVFAGIEAAHQAGLSPVKLNCVIKESSDEPNARAVAAYAQKHNCEIRYIRWMDLSKGQFWQVDGGEGGKCDSCNRLRLTADGTIKPCLFSDLGFNVRKLGIEQALDQALQAKPESGKHSQSHNFYNIGG